MMVLLLVHLTLSSLRVAVRRQRNVFGSLSWYSHVILLMWWIVRHQHGIVLVSSSCGWVGRHHYRQHDTTLPPKPKEAHGPPSSSSPTTVRYRARVAYNGYRYQGFQLQPSRNPEKQQQQQEGQHPPTTTTIQGELERVLNQQWRMKSGNFVHYDDSDPRRTIKVVAAGRTDAGVHARGQAIHFDVPAVVVVPGFLSGGSSTKPNESIAESNIADSCLLDAVPDQNLWNDATTILDNDEKAVFHLNKKLPPDIRIWNLQRVPGPVTKEVPLADDKPDEMRSDANTGDDGETTTTTSITRTYLWNAMYECTRKLYSYRLALGPVMPPTERHVRWHYTCHHSLRIDPERLRQVLKHFEGTHNFAAFASAVERTERKLAGASDNAEGSTVLNTIRHVYSVDLVPENVEWGFYRVDVCLKGALYKQVRNMVGTALVVAAEAADGEKGHKSPGATMTETELVALLKINPSSGGGPRLQRQHNKCRPAPPEGLTLEHVFFDNDPEF